MTEPPLTVIVLAGQRAGVVNPLAAAAGVSHKCFVPIAGRPLIEHVLDTLTALPALGEIRISAEADAHDGLRALIARFAPRGIAVRLLVSRPNLIDSVLDAAGEDGGPFLVTTADNVLLTAAAVEQVRRALHSAEGVFALARKENVLAAHPDAQRGFYRFRDGEFANCNIYGIANRQALRRGGEIFRGGGQFMKSVWRMIRAFGPLNILMLRFGAFDHTAAIDRVGRRLGFTLAAIEFTDGALAVDVDNERTFRVCEIILARRAAP